ncbi:putative protease Do-like 14 [Durio zibethinus]|uniref:Protease Do-like 14 n=1 Tax=Durio zibethinus TaxID=66656 RepID=A0A6P6ALE3_DURZI|nr:putative protease Do-like 14 [Durio zibethinus]
MLAHLAQPAPLMIARHRAETPSPWKRKREETCGCFCVTRNTFGETFNSCVKQNIYLNLRTKVSALKVSPSLVALVSHSGDGDLLFACSGTIFECQHQDNSDEFIATILTSATLLTGRSPSSNADIAPNIQVDVYLWDGKTCQGEISACDIHFNLALIKIRSNQRLPTPIFKHLDDSMTLTLPRVLDSTSYELHSQQDMLQGSNSFKICAGDKVIALGRHYLSHELMAAPGVFRFGYCDLDCEQLCIASCKITMGGIGGPLINRHGEVIGINFYSELFTPFLPINAVSKCLENLKNHGRVHQPWLGVKASSLGSASVYKLEKIILKFPQISKGVLVEEVTSESPAAYAGIRPDDIIVQCGGKSVGSSLEFFGFMLDKVGEPVELDVRRPSDGTCLTPTVFAGDRCNRWPIPKERQMLFDTIHM